MQNARNVTTSRADVASAALVPIEVVEVSDDDRNRKCYRQDAGDDAQRPDELAPDADWRDVTVADGRHSDDGPPEGARNASQLCVRLAGLGVVGGRAEDDHGDEQEEEEHPEFVHRRLDRQAQYP